MNLDLFSSLRDDNARGGGDGGGGGPEGPALDPKGIGVPIGVTLALVFVFCMCTIHLFS